MASAELSRRVEKVVAYPPLGDRKRRDGGEYQSSLARVRLKVKNRSSFSRLAVPGVGDHSRLEGLAPVAADKTLRPRSGQPVYASAWSAKGKRETGTAGI
jgi:hypothetical protein